MYEPRRVFHDLYALINNIGPAHIEGFGSIDGVARAKGEIYAGLPEAGIAVVNNDDKYAHFWDDILAQKPQIRFSSASAKTKVYAEHIQMHQRGGSSFQLVTPSGNTQINLKVPGRHHIQNALAAASCAEALGTSLESIAKGLSQFKGVVGRLTPKVTKQGAMILDDTYNANLSSVLAGIDVLRSFEGKRVLVLGDMGELGENTQAHHEAVGSAAADAGLEILLTCGKASLAATHAFGKQAQHFNDQKALADALTPMLDDATTVLVKGSRSSAMEKVVERLLE